MARVIDRSLGEVGDEGLSKFTRMANTLKHDTGCVCT